MTCKVTTEPGFINFHLKDNKTVNKIKSNTYEHCDFVKLCIVGCYTSIVYEGGM